MTRSRADSGASFAGKPEGIIHDGANRAGAAAALRAAAEAAIDIDRFARAGIGRDAIANLGVGKNVAGANDHSQFPCGQIRIDLTYCSATFFSGRP